MLANTAERRMLIWVGQNFVLVGDERSGVAPA
jgi:hypothetical protein